MLHVKLIEPPCTERYARWCERSKIPHQEEFSPTRLYAITSKLLSLCIYRKSYKNFDLCMAFCTYIKYNQNNERYMQRKEGLYAVK